MQGIEGVKKFFLSVVFAGDELNVVDQNAIKGAVLVFKGGNIFGFERRNKLVTKGFSGKITDF